MATQDSYVQVAIDGSGKKVDNATLTRKTYPEAAEETVYRQRVVIASDENSALQADVRGEAGKGVVMVESRSLENIELLLVDIRDMLQMVIGT
jgi:hypothetical protein